MKKYLALSNKQYIVATVVFAATGILLGYIYYITIGCTANGCAITSNPYLSSLWGGLIGYLISGVIFSKKKTPE